MWGIPPPQGPHLRNHPKCQTNKIRAGSILLEYFNQTLSNVAWQASYSRTFVPEPWLSSLKFGATWRNKLSELSTRVQESAVRSRNVCPLHGTRIDLITHPGRMQDPSIRRKAFRYERAHFKVE